MNRKSSYLSLVLAIAVLFAIPACKGSRAANTATGAARIKATIGSNAAKTVALSAGKRAAAAMVGTVADISSITVDIYNGSSMIVQGTPLSNNNGDWSAVVSDLPLGIQLTFTGHAYTGSAQEIFRGTTLQTLAGSNDEIVIRMEPAQTGTTLQFLQISQIGRPASIGVNTIVPVSLSVLGNAGETLTYQVTPAENGGTFSPSSGSITLTGTSATIVLLYTAPVAEGTYIHTVQLTDTHDNSVLTTFDANVAAEILDPTVIVQFNPVVTALTFTRSGSEVTLTAYVSDTGPSNELTYNWSYASDCPWWSTACTDMTFADAAVNPAVLQGYNEENAGSLSLTVANASGGSTTVSFKVGAGKFPESVISNLLLLPHTAMSTAPGSDCRSGAISGNFIALMINDSEVGYYDIANTSWVNTHIAALGAGGEAEYGVAIDGNIMAYVKADTGTIGWYSISAGAGYDTDITPDSGGFGRGDRGPTHIISNGRIAYVSGGTLNIFDTNSNQNITTAVEVPDGRSLTFREDIIAFVGASGTVQYYNVVTELTTDTHQTIGHDKWGNNDIAYPTVDSGTIIFGSSSGYMAYYTISDGRTVQMPFLLSSLYQDGAPSISNGIVAVVLSEVAVMKDLDGNGEIADNGGGVLIFYDIPTRRMINTGVRVCCWGDISNGVFVYDTDEGGINKDVNNDGSLTCVQTYVVMNDLAKQYFGR